MTSSVDWVDSTVGAVLSLDYGKGLVGESRTGTGYPVFGSSGEVGRHTKALVVGPGIVVGRKGTVGSVFWSDQSFWPIDTTYFVRRLCDVNLRWLFWLLSTLDFGALDSSTGVPGLNRNDAYRLPFRLPPEAEQRRIAVILDTLDDAIRRTEQVIAKLQQMKQGLLHDLLTRGVDEHGDLRPTPDEAPHLYKNSPLGRIPTGWDVGPLSGYYREPSRSGLYKPQTNHGRGPLMVQMGQLFHGDSVVFDGAGRVAVSTAELRIFGLQRGDLLFARRSLVMEGAGKCVLVASLPEPSTFESSIVRVRLSEGRLRPDFASLFLKSYPASLDRRRFIRQVAVSGVSSSDIREFLVAVPPPDEQDAILDSSQREERRLTEESRAVEKLVLVKHGLLHDLVTGRVRVQTQAEDQV